MSFISDVHESQRPALFQSLLFEACGRTVNPVNGAVGLLSTGNWHVCQAAVETVLHGGTPRPVPEFMAPTSEYNETTEAAGTAEDMWKLQETVTSLNSNCQFSGSRSKISSKRETMEGLKKLQPSDLDICLNPGFKGNRVADNRRTGSPSMNSEESVTTATCFESGFADHEKLLNLSV
ncbi:LOB domain-containing protein 38 [Hibiscus syriacus]|uniref:LOB domain-containing protein 38 n=1 Tax=Hibiscus syriacus TaxID=106335 RepID=A0A6A2ZRX2_HIBSY|nr:LOB domain-containing protein 38 [Hibiscus syriacus]